MNRFANPRAALRWLEWKRLEGNSRGLWPAAAAIFFLCVAFSMPGPTLALGVAIAMLATSSWLKAGNGRTGDELLLVHGIRHHEFVTARWRRDHFLVLGLSGIALVLGLLNPEPDRAPVEWLGIAFGLPFYQFCTWVLLGATGEAAAHRRNAGVLLLWPTCWSFASVPAHTISDGVVIAGVATAATCFALGTTVGLRSVIRRAFLEEANHERADTTPRVRPAHRWLGARRRVSASPLRSLIAAGIGRLRRSSAAWIGFVLTLEGTATILVGRGDPFLRVVDASFFLVMAVFMLILGTAGTTKQGSDEHEFMLTLPITRGMLHSARTLVVLAFFLIPALLTLAVLLGLGLVDVDARSGDDNLVAYLVALTPALFFALLQATLLFPGAGRGGRRPRGAAMYLGLLVRTLFAGYMLGWLIWKDLLNAKLEQWGPTLTAHPVAVLSGTVTVGLVSWALSRAHFRHLEIV